MNPLLRVVPLFASLLLGGCASHINSPVVAQAREARRAAFSDPLLARAFDAKPALRFPSTIALATNDHGTRDHLRALSAHGKFDDLKSLPQIADVVPLSSLLYSTGTKPDLAMREAAARVHADAVLIVTTETNATDGRLFAPLTELSLGLFPNKRYELIATALAALVDVRTGYVYGTLEQSRARSGLTMTWGSDDVIAHARAAAEREALGKLFGEFPAFWRGVVQTHKR
jgi:hypothetical protein